MPELRSELDGDILMILPGEDIDSNDIKINKEIMAIHKENVDAAVRNWNSFMQNILTALNFLIEITGLPTTEYSEGFKTPAPGPSAPSTNTASNSPTTAKSFMISV